MAEKDSTTIIEGEGQEGQPGGGFPLCEECGEIARLGERLCPACKRGQAQEAARKELIDERTSPEDLIVLLDKATFGLKSFCKILDNEEYDEIALVLTPLVDRLWADLEKIEALIAGSLGNIKVMVCTDSMRVDDKHYCEGDFYKAVLEPKEARDQVCPLQ